MRLSCSKEESSLFEPSEHAILVHSIIVKKTIW